MPGQDTDDLRGLLRTLPALDSELPSFEVEHQPGDPEELFRSWLRAAIEANVREPHAMTLSTVDSQGRPNSRILLLKGVADGRWQFATSRSSPTGCELEQVPWAAANFYWREVGRQVRIRGRVHDAGPAEAARDFLARSEGSRAESLIGRQSAELTSRSDLDTALAEALARVRAEPGTVPEHWASYDLVAEEVEFWQADRERRHTRLRYRLLSGAWTRKQLWP